MSSLSGSSSAGNIVSSPRPLAVVFTATIPDLDSPAPTISITGHCFPTEPEHLPECTIPISAQEQQELEETQPATATPQRKHALHNDHDDVDGNESPRNKPCNITVTTTTTAPDAPERVDDDDEEDPELEAQLDQEEADIERLGVEGYMEKLRDDFDDNNEGRVYVSKDPAGRFTYRATTARDTTYRPATTAETATHWSNARSDYGSMMNYGRWLFFMDVSKFPIIRRRPGEPFNVIDTVPVATTTTTTTTAPVPATAPMPPTTPTTTTTTTAADPETDPGSDERHEDLDMEIQVYVAMHHGHHVFTLRPATGHTYRRSTRAEATACEKKLRQFYEDLLEEAMQLYPPGRPLAGKSTFCGEYADTRFPFVKPGTYDILESSWDFNMDVLDFPVPDL